MANYELLQESVSDHLFDESVGYLTEGATLDINKKLRELQKEYRGITKDIRDAYKEKDYNGWVFMDYRNNAVDLDDNTIIYAHNRFSSGIMFGTLPNIRKKSWLDNKDNYYITFNTMNKVQKWKIFSYYVVDVTSDYLITNFESDKDHQAFIKKITKRSKKNFKEEVTTKDKILTLSTCYNKEDRFVVHAVLINEDEENTEVNNNAS